MRCTIWTVKVTLVALIVSASIVLLMAVNFSVHGGSWRQSGESATRASASPTPLFNSTACSPTTRNSSAQTDPSASRRAPRHPIAQERAVICMIAHGWKVAGYEEADSIKGSRRSMDIALRGILRSVSNQCAIHFYFITGDADATRIRGSFWGSIRYAPTNVTYEFLPLDEQQLSGWMQQIGHTPTHRTGAAGNVKFFYPLLLPQEERVLMLDSDVLVGRDVCKLWSQFHRFSETQLFSFAPQKIPMSHAKDNQFNAGVGLLHLGRMRRAGWLQLAAASIRFWHARGMRPPCCAHGDQSVFHMIRFYRPSALVHYLPRWWNINKCHRYLNFEAHYRAWQEQRKKLHYRADDRSEIGGSAIFGSAQPAASSAAALPPHQRCLSLNDDDEVFVGIVHLGCCKKCKRALLAKRWQHLLDEIVAFDPSIAYGSAAGGTVRELTVRLAAVDRNTTNETLAASSLVHGLE